MREREPHRPTAKQQAYAKVLRQQIMATSKTKLGWNNEDAHTHFANWGYGESLRALPVDRLLALKRDLEQLISGKPLKGRKKHTPTKPSAPLPEVSPQSASARGMATPKQIMYTGVLAARYAELQGIPQEYAYAAWHRFALKTCKHDHIRWCTQKQASTLIGVMEKVFVNQFGAAEFEALTGKPYRITKPTK